MAGYLLRGARISCIALLLLSSAVVCTSDSAPPMQRVLPDSMTTAWTAAVPDLEGGTSDPAYHGDFTTRPEAAFSPQVAALPNLNKIEIRDPKTGRMLHDITVGEKVGDISIAAGVVVAQTGEASNRNFDYSMLRGYDIASGRQLWAQNIRTSHTVRTGRPSIFGGAAVTTRGVVAMTSSGDMIGLDLKTGRRGWIRRVPCSKVEKFSATTAMAVVLCDEDPPTLVDPQTGKLRQLGAPGQGAYVSVTANAIGVASHAKDSASQPLKVVAESGTLLGQIKGLSYVLLVSGDRVVTTVGDQIRAVSMAHGTELWRRKIESEIAPENTDGSDVGISVSDGMVLVNRVMDRGHPGATTFTDLSGKTTPPLPWPVSGEFAGAVPGLVFLVSHAEDQYQFTAVRLDNKNLNAPRLGGATPADWPDPCRLLAPQQLATLGRGYTGVHAPTSPIAARLHLPHADQCNFAGKHPFSLQVGWVVADDTAAAMLAQSFLPGPDWMWQIGANGYQYINQTATVQAVADRAVAIQGRLVINVFAPRQVALTAKITRLVQATPRLHPASGTADALDKAVAEKILKDHGFTAAIQLWPPIPGPLRAIYANCGSQCHQVFLFHGSQLVGAPPGESATSCTYQYLQVLRQDGRIVKLAAGVFPPHGPQILTKYALIELQMSGNRLIYRVDSGPWQAATTAPHYRTYFTLCGA